jgi:hypothetical protein
MASARMAMMEELNFILKFEIGICVSMCGGCKDEIWETTQLSRALDEI